MIGRRTILTGAVVAPWLGAASGEGADLRSHIAALETSSGGRLGVAMLDTGSGKRFAWRGDERFAFCSTFKFLLAAAILQRVDQGQEQFGRRLTITKGDLLPHSPVSGLHVGRGAATVGLLVQAIVEVSDNGAANLLLASVGGPLGLTKILRSWGDQVSRLDRTEPALNEAIPGDPRDTTSPLAMLAELRRIALGDVLRPESRALLVGWMENCQTGQARLRAGLPAGWVVGDKTGTNDHGTANDIAIAWPPGRAPVLITCYLSNSTLPPARQDAVHEAVARLLVTYLN
jgi:beta-lactamase class A